MNDSITSRRRFRDIIMVNFIILFPLRRELTVCFLFML
jgi:hypothetical protein